MKRIPIGLLLTVSLFLASAPAFAQTDEALEFHAYTTVKPWLEGQMEGAMMQSALAATIPLSTYNITSSRDGNTYSGTIVGRNPLFHGARTTHVPVFLVPLIVVMPDTGHVFDPTAADPFGCLPPGTNAFSLTSGSPIFQAPPNDWVMNGVDVGKGQYNDVFQRAEFFSNVSLTGNRYHTSLSVNPLKAQTFKVPAGQGQTVNLAGSGCGEIGLVDFTTMDNFLVGTLIPSLAKQGIGPTNFPLFLLYNVVMTDAGGCCILGYHGATGSPLQTYSPTDFDSTGAFTGVGDTSVLAHEIGEWLNDPAGINPTPAWGHTGQVSGCQDNLEVGDPLTGTNFPAVMASNGFTYHLQELAFFSWFYGGPPLGAGAMFSNNGTFSNDAGSPCT